MKMQQVMLKCAEKGVYFSRQAIYEAGEKYGFVTKKNEKTALEFDQKKFEKWLEKVTEEIPQGFYTMKECSQKLNLSITTVWNYCKNYSDRIEIKSMGSKKGVLYVNIEQLGKIIAECKYGTEEKYGN